MASPAKPKSAAAGENEAAPKRTVKCPICGEPSVPEFFPFSSKHCANVDLNRWLTGAYFIPAGETAPGIGPEPEREVPTDEDEG
jgi:endogenous inhibitor of DNA gyrase (YacG/DUF329 family)